MVDLPFFRYHPDPLRTGAIRRQPVECVVCGLARDYTYVASAYCRESIRETVCPWCVADGSAAARFDATFSDDSPLIDAGLAASIVDEVTRRTPGYISWQQEVWQVHCNDACAFLGDASAEELRAMEPEAKAQFLRDNRLSTKVWEHILAGYEPGGSPSFYRFACLHCATNIITMDGT